MHDRDRSSTLAMVAKKRYGVRETYWITHDAVLTLRPFVTLRRERGARFTERIMLAVTEVNGCALCAYAHTRFGIEAGLGPEEIRRILGGVTDDAPDEELPAIAFAQHYADTRAHPDPEAWERLVEVYGEGRALGVLGAIRVMMWGNAAGIPWSSLLSRLRGSPDPRQQPRPRARHDRRHHGDDAARRAARRALDLAGSAGSLLPVAARVVRPCPEEPRSGICVV